MSGNEDLRRALNAASTLTSTSSYARRLAELLVQYNHTITTEPAPMPMNRFNCFAFAFGLTEHVDYGTLVDLAQTSAALDSAKVKAMLDAGDLAAVEPHLAKQGDIALYIDGDTITHAGRVTAPGRIQSKWGGNEIHAHGLWEVPLGYGHTVTYIATPDTDSIIQRLIYQAKA